MISAISTGRLLTAMVSRQSHGHTTISPIQFRENLEVAYRLYPGDLLKALVEGECDTDNLSPWPGVVEAGEKVNHDEFMRRLLTLSPIEPAAKQRIEAAGVVYLSRTRAEDDVTKASSMASLRRWRLGTAVHNHADLPVLGYAAARRVSAFSIEAHQL